MSRRSKAREVALQMLFQVDMNPDVDGQMVAEMVRELLPEVDLRELAITLFDGTFERRNDLDERIQTIATNWKLSRMAATDRNVLRLGAFEILHSDTPRKVAIDEALELAKKFGSEQSSQFVNGILDKLDPAVPPAAEEAPAGVPPE
ncbi:MAG: transcription antitermination factor NusB [Planctomycetaceae bacterium]